VNVARPRLAFISPVFLFPNDTGGRIRTTNILRGLKGGVFEVTLCGPADSEQRRLWGPQLDGLCDSFVPWEPVPPLSRWRRAWDLLDPLPVNVVADRTPAARLAVQRTLLPEAFDIVVFDFVHAAVLRPPDIDMATVCFTHNVEAEIFARHAEQARSALMRAVWSTQSQKMQRFEAQALRRFTSVIAVSERDAACFRERYGIVEPAVIPTGVDLQFFAWSAPPPVGVDTPPTVVFTGSMDWSANIDGVDNFLERVWPLVLKRAPSARFVVVGRSPPSALVERGRTTGGVTFTGFVDDVRPYVQRAHVFVIPLRVGGGTRIKAFEAMAMGCPVVSTAIGVEGLAVRPEEHYLLRNGAEEMADAIVALLEDEARRRTLAERARRHVEAGFGHRIAARAFERACVEALDRFRAASVRGTVPA
jgi:glycosyltransferase involved in cell wall biosynthesis